jgi:hypothetical protein
VSQPELIDQLVRTSCDFAIYNWCADEYTDCFVPIELSLSADEPPIKNRFYRVTGSTPWYSTTQMVCFGCTQFYRNSLAARVLLSRWHRTIVAFPGSVDDCCLDFFFNNLTRRSWLSWLLKVHWLPKSYARYPWWIHTKPIIKHPDIPRSTSEFIPIEDPRGREEVYHSLMKQRNPVWLFPPGCIIDVDQHMVCKLVDGQLVPIEPTDQNFWL